MSRKLLLSEEICACSHILKRAKPHSINSTLMRVPFEELSINCLLQIHNG